MNLILMIVALIALILAVGAAVTARMYSEDSEALEVIIGPELVSCMGMVPMDCMVVDGELFYDRIEGFYYEQGYRYKIRMERFDAWPGMKEPPADASRYGYRLVEIIEKVRAE